MDKKNRVEEKCKIKREEKSARLPGREDSIRSRDYCKTKTSETYSFR
jgi:hypothetical protein